MNNVTESVWSRYGSDKMSASAFNVIMVAAFLIATYFAASAALTSIDWGLIKQVTNDDGELVDAIYVAIPSIGTWPYIAFALVLFGVSIVGTFMVTTSDEPVVSFGGLAIMAASMGLMLGPALAGFPMDMIQHVFGITMLVVAGLGLLGAIYPKSLEGWGIFLFGGLLVLIIGQFGLGLLAYIFPGMNTETALRAQDWFGIILFSGYVIYDFNRAQRVPKTWDNAIDCAASIFLDAINLFIRILIEYSKSKK